jgi:hypothetical protein
MTVITQHKTLRFVTRFILWFHYIGHTVMNELFIETKKVSVSNIPKERKVIN